jgi:hypothetical protein
MEHGAKAATSFTALIKQTVPKGGLPGKKRSLVIGKAGDKPVMLVSPKRPANALNELNVMSKKLGKVTPLAIGQVFFEDNVIHVKALRNANEAVVKKAFLDYYRTYKVSPPSIKIKLWQPAEWEAVEFEEEADDAPEDESGTATTDDDAEGDEGDDEAENDEDSGASPSDKARREPASADALRKELGALILRIRDASGASAPVIEQLKKLANAAAAALKAGNADVTTAVMAKLRELLNAEPAGAAVATAGSEPDQTGEQATVAAQSSNGQQPNGDDLLTTFRDAKEEVDAALNKLQAALQETGNPDMVRIAEFGLYGLTGAGGQGVGLMRALLALRAATPDKREAMAKAASGAAAAYKAALLSDTALIDLVDQNPFNVPVGIRSKLVAALDLIANAS